MQATRRQQPGMAYPTGINSHPWKPIVPYDPTTPYVYGADSPDKRGFTDKAVLKDPNAVNLISGEPVSGADLTDSESYLVIPVSHRSSSMALMLFGAAAAADPAAIEAVTLTARIWGTDEIHPAFPQKGDAGKCVHVATYLCTLSITVGTVTVGSNFADALPAIARWASAITISDDGTGGRAEVVGAHASAGSIPILRLNHIGHQNLLIQIGGGDSGLGGGGIYKEFIDMGSHTPA